MDIATLKSVLNAMEEKIKAAQATYNLSPTPFNEGVVQGWHRSRKQVEQQLAEELAQRDRYADFLDAHFNDSLPDQLEGLSCKS